MLDDAVACVVNDSRPAAERLLIEALAAAASLDTFSERGRLPFIHGARDLARSRLEI